MRVSGSIVVVCGGAVLGLVMGFRHTLGLFLDPISVELGLGREVFALSIGLMNLLWGLGAPVAGGIADRFGAGRVVAAGGLAYAGGLAMLSIEGGGSQLMLGGLLLGCGLSGAGLSVVLGAVARAVGPEKRSQALGIASVGGSLGQFLAVPYVRATLDVVHWTTSLLVIAATSLAIVALAGGLRGTAGPTLAQTGQTMTEAFAEAMHHPGFWLLTAGFFVCGFHLAFVAVHLPAFVSDQGLSPRTGALALTLIGLCNVLGTWGCGVLGGRFRKKSVLAGLYLARAAVFLAFLVVPISVTSVLVLASVLGLLWLGTVPLTSGLVAHIFGPGWMSMLFGVVFFSHQVGGFLGAWGGGWLSDRLGSYDAMWWLSVGLGVASAALHWPISERPVPRLETRAT